jgi:hypothetical protein
MDVRRCFAGALALLASHATGCVFDIDDDDDDDVVEAGYFRATWTLTADGFPVSCFDVGGDTVSYIFTDSYGQGDEDLFDCEAMAGNTDPLPIDDFTLSVSLLSSAQAVLGRSEPLGPEDGVTLYECDFVTRDYCVRNLPNIEFVF